MNPPDSQKINQTGINNNNNNNPQMDHNLDELANRLSQINVEMIETNPTTNNHFERGRFQYHVSQNSDTRNTLDNNTNRSDWKLTDKYNSGDDNTGNENNKKGMQYLTIPKLTKQFLISPPASPPTDWEPVHEGPPVIDVQLISAIANLVPGEVHEIHSGNENQPGIFVEVCEEIDFGSNGKSPSMDDYSNSSTTNQRIPKTPCPVSYHFM